MSWAVTYRTGCIRMGVPGLQFLPRLRGMRCPDPTNFGSRQCHVYWGFLESELSPPLLLAALLVQPYGGVTVSCVTQRGGQGALMVNGMIRHALGYHCCLRKAPDCRQAQEGKRQEELLARPPKLQNKSSRAFSPADTHLLSSGERGKFYRVSSFQEALVLLVFGGSPGKIPLESWKLLWQDSC